MTPEERRQASYEKRVQAAEIARDRKYTYRDTNSIDGALRDQPTEQLDNNDELIAKKPMSFT